MKKWRERSKYQIPEGQSETDKGYHKGGNISDKVSSLDLMAQTTGKGSAGVAV